MKSKGEFIFNPNSFMSKKKIIIIDSTRQKFSSQVNFVHLNALQVVEIAYIFHFNK